MPDLFVSYAREDQELVRGFVAGLTARGREVWVDWEDIPPTSEWMAEIRGAVEGSDAFVFVISPDSCASEVCRKELDQAIANNKRVIALTARETTEAVPEPIASVTSVAAHAPGGIGGAVDAVLRALDADGDWVRAHTRLLVRALEWESRSQDRNLLLRGKELEEAETWLARQKKDPAPTPMQASFALASRRAATRRQRGAVTITLSIVAAVSLLTLVAVVQRAAALDKANLAASRGLAANASSTRADPQLSLLLALEAWKAKHTPQAEQAVREAVVATKPSHADELVYDKHEFQRVALAYDGKGRQLAIATGDGMVRVIDPVTGKGITWRASTAQENALAFSTDGRRVATGGDGVRVWNAKAARRPRLSLPTPDVVFAVAFSPDGKHVFAAGQQGFVWMWDASSGRKEREFKGNKQLVYDLSVSPDGKHLACAGESVLVWAIDDPSHPRRLKGHEGLTHRVKFSGDGKQLASSGDDGRIRTWDRRTGRSNLVLVDESVYDIAFAPDGKRIASIRPDGTMSLWELRAQPLRVRVLPPINNGESDVYAGGGGASYFGTAVTFAPDGKTIAVGYYGTRVHIVPCEVCTDMDAVMRLARARTKRSLTRDELKRYGLQR